MNSALQIKSSLHHNAYVTDDMEAVRKFYEEVIGYSLVATWAEKAELFGRERTYMHCFFDIGDGSCLAFFQFADSEDQAEFGPELAPSAFRHLAMKVDQPTQDAIRDRIAAAGISEPETYILDHGYCYSLYVKDPSGLLVEFTVDHDDVDAINAERKRQAHEELANWLAGDHTPNNTQFHR
ncbi:putative glyoxalase/bleomycin resistance protein/dioxygenase [gamma proteobacterium NOR5-3]|nr:putative glyoxalase/bleomycin resistance protein/dioxygenase [gamma proteobacterium NOR5-3]